jgi:hypothetical protein
MKSQGFLERLMYPLVFSQPTIPSTSEVNILVEVIDIFILKVFLFLLFIKRLQESQPKSVEHQKTHTISIHKFDTRNVSVASYIFTLEAR